MVHYVHQEVTSATQQTIVCPVNCSGVMTEGLMRKLIPHYRGLEGHYRKLCASGSLRKGRLLLWKKEKQWILLFPVKGDYRDRADLSYLEKGLGKLSYSWKEKQITSLALPKLGCENEELAWTKVIYLLENRLARLQIDSWIYIGEPEFDSLRLLYRDKRE